MSDAVEEPARIVIAGAERLRDCRALWLVLRDHHGSTDPHVGALRDDDDSWQRALAAFGKGVQAGEGFVVLAEQDGRPADAPVACAIVSIADGSPTWTAPDRVGTVEVLAVDPGARGLGLGRAVLDAVQEELERRGITEQRLVVTAGNLGSQAFYRELGFETFALVMRRPG